MKYFGYLILGLIVLFFGSMAVDTVKRDVAFRDKCNYNGGVFEVVGHQRKCFAQTEIKI